MSPADGFQIGDVVETRDKQALFRVKAIRRANGSDWLMGSDSFGYDATQCRLIERLTRYSTGAETVFVQELRKEIDAATEQWEAQKKAPDRYRNGELRPGARITHTLTGRVLEVTGEGRVRYRRDGSTEERWAFASELQRGVP